MEDKGGQSWTHGGGDTNLKIPVHDPINMAVMDTLQDLLYAVAEGMRVMNENRIQMEQMAGEIREQKKGRGKERRGEDRR